MSSETRNTIIALTMIVLFMVGIIRFVVLMDERATQDYKEKHVTGHWMPKDASNIVDVGNGWQEFTYKGERFLFYRSTHLDRGYACIVNITPKTVEASDGR